MRLEPLGAAHVEALARAAAVDRASFAWTFVPDGKADVARYVAEAEAARARGAALPFAIVSRALDRVVGATRLGSIERWEWPPAAPLARTPEAVDAAEIGWTWLEPAAQRSGVNTESKKLLFALAFETLGAHRVTLVADVRNARSRAAIERIGARFEGILRAHFPAPDGAVRDSAAFSVLAREWPEVRARLDALLGARGARRDA